MNDLAVLDEELKALYKEEAEYFIPLAAFDGYGVAEETEKLMSMQPQAETWTKHYFSDGVYTRETFIPSGTILTGYRHRFKSVSILAQGSISVVAISADGRASEITLLEDYGIFVTEAMTKKVGFAHTDCLFINSFNISSIPESKWSEEYLEEIEEFLFVKVEE